MELCNNQQEYQDKARVNLLDNTQEDSAIRDT